MPKIKYMIKKFSAGSLEVIEAANTIIDDYLADGFTLTLRQLYYQFVARGLLANEQKQYKRLGGIIHGARMSGLIDWEAIEDRTREAIEDRTRGLASLATWDRPQEILRACARQFRYDKWQKQSTRVEVWIEKEALAGVFESACREYEVPFLSSRGYGSASAMWLAAQRLKQYLDAGQDVLLLHFGDHDPSGIDMTRDIRARLRHFLGIPAGRVIGMLPPVGNLEVRRVALNMDQIEQYNPPPNPAKITDSRAAGYIAQYGKKSWELDALEPAVLAELVQGNVLEVLDEALWQEDLDREEGVKDIFRGIGRHWYGVVDLVRDLGVGPDTSIKFFDDDGE